MANQLYYGDCLDVLRNLYKENPKGFIDLIYIDPPFNSKRNYNILFESAGLNDTKAQKEAFADTWSNISYKETLNELADLDINLYNFLNTLDSITISKSAVSYLTTMAIRIYYICKVLKDTGSFYLHCDPTMSHYLKIVCDMIFGDKNYRNEIIWKRTSAGKPIYRNLPKNNDNILFYTKSDKYTFHPITEQLSKEDIKTFNLDDKDGKGAYNTQPIINPADRPHLKYVYVDLKGRKWNPPTNGWRFNEERMRKLEKEDGLYFTKKTIREKYYLKDRLEKGKQVSNIWVDIPITSKEESLGYPTQKPNILLERIIRASSNEKDLVADFFCGCGTTIAAAQNLNRPWLGVDISHLSIGLIERKRLIEPYIGSDEKVKPKYEIHGLPRDIAGAKQLANKEKGGRLKFEQWIVEAKLNAVLNDAKNQLGHDGYTTFEMNGKKHVVLIEVKSGNATVTQLNHFIKTVDGKKADMGVFVCFKNEVTKNMELVAKNEGYSLKETYNNAFDKIQILTVEDIIENKGIKMPYSTEQLFKTSKKKITKDSTQGKLDIE